GQFLWPGTGISTVRLWAVFHGRQHSVMVLVQGIRSSSITSISSGTQRSPPNKYEVTHWSSRLLGRHPGSGTRLGLGEWMTPEALSVVKQRCQVYSLCHLPKVSGRSRQAVAGRN